MTANPAPARLDEMPREPAAELRLDDQLCFALYTAASAVVRNYRPLLAKLGLTYPQYIVLMTLWEHDHRTANGSTTPDTSATDSTGNTTGSRSSEARTDDLNVGEIAARLRVPVHNIAPLLDRLENAGLLQRRRSHHDRRHIDVALTDDGRALEHRAARAQHQVRCQTQLSPPALDALRTELHTLTHTLDDNLDDNLDDKF